MRIAPVLGGSPVGLEGHVEDDPAGTDVCHERGDALPGLLRGGFGCDTDGWSRYESIC